MLFSRQAVALETEWGCDPYVYGDFQKLIQARADVRVWVAVVGDEKDANQQIKNCKVQIKHFAGSMTGDEYVLIVFCERGVLYAPVTCVGPSASKLGLTVVDYV